MTEARPCASQRQREADERTIKDFLGALPGAPDVERGEGRGGCPGKSEQAAAPAAGSRMACCAGWARLHDVFQLRHEMAGDVRMNVIYAIYAAEVLLSFGGGYVVGRWFM
jgi:hypothetical protein